MNTNTLAAGNETQSYSLAEAERLLPLIQTIANEIRERHAKRRELQTTRAQLEASRSPEGFSTALADLDADIFDQTEGLRGAIDDLIALRLSVLRLDPVTIHIPGRSVSGPLVFCWQVGDDGIQHGHRVGEEDDPRRPLKVRVPRTLHD